MKDLVLVITISLTVLAATMLKNETNSQSTRSVDQKFISFNR
ncbi:MAG: hypothetical protein ACXVLQ_14215 [Bacteriovorax sp.]